MTDNTLEEWRAIPDYEGVYEVSSLGRVRRVAPGQGVKRLGEPMAPQLNRGYATVRLNSMGGKTTTVHRLVALAFLGPKPDGHEVHHKNADRADNRASNLEYVTRSGNVTAMLKMGRGNPRRGSDNSWAKLTEDDVLAIRAAYPEVSGPKLAAKYGIGTTTVYAIIKRRKWRHI